MNKKLIFTLLLCLFSQGLKAEPLKAPFYKNDAKMAQATSLFFGVLLGVKSVAEGYEVGGTVVSFTAIKKSSGIFQISPIKDYGKVQLRILAGNINNALSGYAIIAAGLVAAWYVGKVIKNKLWAQNTNDSNLTAIQHTLT